MDKTQRRQMLREYRKEHGHHPQDYKARIDCVTCNAKSLVEHAIISVSASGDPEKYKTFIAATGYSEGVKVLALKRFET